MVRAAGAEASKQGADGNRTQHKRACRTHQGSESPQQVACPECCDSCIQRPQNARLTKDASYARVQAHAKGTATEPQHSGSAAGLTQKTSTIGSARSAHPEIGCYVTKHASYLCKHRHDKWPRKRLVHFIGNRSLERCAQVLCERAPALGTVGQHVCEALAEHLVHLVDRRLGLLYAGALGDIRLGLIGCGRGLFPQPPGLFGVGPVPGVDLRQLGLQIKFDLSLLDRNRAVALRHGGERLLKLHFIVGHLHVFRVLSHHARRLVVAFDLGLITNGLGLFQQCLGRPSGKVDALHHHGLSLQLAGGFFHSFLT